MDGVEDGMHNAIMSITQNCCMNLIKYLKVSNDNDFSVLRNRLKGLQIDCKFKQIVYCSFYKILKSYKHNSLQKSTCLSEG